MAMKTHLEYDGIQFQDKDNLSLLLKEVIWLVQEHQGLRGKSIHRALNYLWHR